MSNRRTSFSIARSLTSYAPATSSKLCLRWPARLALLTACVLAPAAVSAEATVDSIRSCMRRNVVDRGSLRQLDVAVTDAEGKTRTLAMKLFWKPTAAVGDERMTLQISAPADLAGTAYLVRATAQGDEVYTYLPALDRVQKVGGGDATRPLWGTDFTYAEITQVQGNFQAGTTSRVADGSVLGRTAWVLNTDTDADRSGYDSILSYVDQETCTLLRAELLAGDGRVLKVLEAEVDSLLQVDQHWLMLRYVMRDVGKRTQTRLTLGDLFLRENLPDSLFAPESFYRALP